MDVEYKHLLYGQLADYEASHPALFRLKVADEHYPRCFPLLHSCPDIYDDFPCFFYLQRGDRIVASMAALSDTATIDGQTVPWAWWGALFTSPDCRGQGLGNTLMDGVIRTFDEHGITIGGSFASPISVRMCLNLGFQMTGRAPRLVLLKSARPFLSPHVPANVIVTLLDAPYRVLAGGIRALTSSGGRQDTETAPLMLAGGEAEGAGVPPGATAPRYHQPCHFNDTWDKFRWKVAQCKDARIYHITERASGGVLARFVTKTRLVTGAFAEKYTGFRLMTLMDYMVFGEPEAGYAALANVVTRQFWESDAVVLESVAASDALNKRLRRKFMVPGGKGVAFFYKTPRGVTLPPVANDVSHWHFTHFSTDAFSFS